MVCSYGRRCADAPLAALPTAQSVATGARVQPMLRQKCKSDLISTLRTRYALFLGWLGIRVVSVLDSGAVGPVFESQLLPLPFYALLTLLFFLVLCRNCCFGLSVIYCMKVDSCFLCFTLVAVLANLLLHIVKFVRHNQLWLMAQAILVQTCLCCVAVLYIGKNFIDRECLQ